MPYTIAVDRAQKLTRVRFAGITTGRDIIAATDELVRHPDYEEAFDQLWVLVDVPQLLIDPEELAALVEHDRAFVEDGVMGQVRVAIVVTGQLREVVIRLYEYQMRSSGQQIQLFSEEAAAEAWLREPHGSGVGQTS